MKHEIIWISFTDMNNYISFPEKMKVPFDSFSQFKKSKRFLIAVKVMAFISSKHQQGGVHLRGSAPALTKLETLVIYTYVRDAFPSPKKTKKKTLQETSAIDKVIGTQPVITLWKGLFVPTFLSRFFRIQGGGTFFIYQTLPQTGSQQYLSWRNPSHFFLFFFGLKIITTSILYNAYQITLLCVWSEMASVPLGTKRKIQQLHSGCCCLVSSLCAPAERSSTTARKCGRQTEQHQPSESSFSSSLSSGVE